MSRKRLVGAAPIPTGAVRKLADGRTMTRAPNAETQVQQVPGHGHVVLRQVTFRLEDGRSWLGWDWDLCGLELPDGAVPADPHAQSFGITGPKLWYANLDRTCVQCREPFVFSGAEQRFWYETLKFNHASTAIRCPKCRKRRRSLGALRRQLDLALRGTEEFPEEADRWLELARVSGELREQSGQGDLDRGLSAARKAWRLSDEGLPEALYWEAVFQRLAGREDRAAAAEDEFLALASTRKRLRPLARTVEQRRARR